MDVLEDGPEESHGGSKGSLDRKRGTRQSDQTWCLNDVSHHVKSTERQVRKRGGRRRGTKGQPVGQGSRIANGVPTTAEGLGFTQRMNYIPGHAGSVGRTSDERRARARMGWPGGWRLDPWLGRLLAFLDNPANES